MSKRKRKFKECLDFNDALTQFIVEYDPSGQELAAALSWTLSVIAIQNDISLEKYLELQKLGYESSKKFIEETFGEKK